MYNKSYLLALFLFFYTCQFTYGQLYINEVMSSNNTAYADTNGEFDDWIEIYNSNNVAIDLANYYISDDVQNPLKWQIPATNQTATTIAAGSYLILWADQHITQGENHIGFKLSSLGETIILTNPDGNTVEDNVTFPSMLSDHSFGRLPDGSANLVVFNSSSPNATNATNLPTANKPLIFPSSGSYSTTQTVLLSSDQNANVYYTLDGSDPTASSTLYNGTPITISSTQVIKAISVLAGYNNSLQSTAAYAINESTNVPMVFLTTDPDNLFDNTTGIYCDGTNGVIGGCGVTTPVNYYQDWERPGNVVYIETNGNVGFNKNIRVETSGGCTRHLAKKSLNVKFDNNEDGDEIDYKFFDTKDELTYAGFKLRNFGNWCWTRRIDDGLLHRVMENKMDLDMQSSQLVSVYLNGQYWGVYNLRDRTNKNYMKTHHPKVDEDNLDFLKNPLGQYRSTKSGDTIAYSALVNYMLNNDLSIQSNYEYVKTKVDMNSQINYSLSHVYYNARDWPGNNSIVWREREPDSKFRFISFDLDSYLTNPYGTQLFSLLFEQGSDPVGWKQDEPISTIYKRTMNNAEYKAEYFQRMRTYIATIWNPANVLPIFNDLKNEMAGEIQADLNRWENDYTYGYWLDATRYDLATWQTNVDDIYDFFVTRPGVITPVVDTFLGSPGDFTLTINANNSTNGYVALHSEYIKLPNNYSASYFKNNPIEILAVPNPGYRFSHWQETGNTNAALYQSFTTNTTLTPIFEAVDDLVINEIYYNPTGATENAEFIEIFNPDSNPRDLRGYQLSDGVCIQFDENTVIQPNEYLVIAKDASLYNGNGFTVLQWEKTSLSNGGETVTLTNPFGAVIDSVQYDDASPWPTDADGAGYSLALINETANNDLATNWKIQPGHLITPGAKNIFCDIFNGDLTTTGNVSCNGGNNGFIQSNITGGNMPYSFNWSNGTNNPAATQLIAGTYTVNVTDAANCNYNDQATITEPTAINLSAVWVDESVQGQNDGVINLAASGGVPPYIYDWSNGAVSQDINNLPAGTYTVNVTDANGCTENYSVIIQPGVLPCNNPTNIAASNIQNSSATLSWSTDANVTNYEVQYRISGVNSWTSFNSNFSFAILNNLQTCTLYEVRIKANCPSAQISNYSNIYTFETAGCVAPCATINGLFSQNVTTSSAFLVWDIVPNATYTMYYRAVGNASWFSYPTQFPIAILFTLPSCTDFEWYVEVNCPNGQISNPSPIEYFTTVGAACKTDFSTNFQNESIQDEVVLYPNPTENFITVKFNSNIEIENAVFNIYAIDGKILSSESDFLNIGKNDKQIDVNNLPDGSYFIKIIAEDKVFIKQFTKQ